MSAGRAQPRRDHGNRLPDRPAQCLRAPGRAAGGAAGGRRPWTGMDLARVLTETLDLAKLRAVDAESLGELGQYMPALYFGFNAADDAVSTDFGPLS